MKKRLSKLTEGKFVTYENKNSLLTIIEGIRNYNNGIYELGFNSVENKKLKGVFREITVKVNYKKFMGIDNRAGYPIPY